MSDWFNIDEKVPYEEWLKTIMHHAWNYEIITSDLHKQRVTVSRLIDTAKGKMRERQYAFAYYYVNRCLVFFDKDKNNVDITRNDADTRRIYMEALDLAERLQKRELRIEYNALISEIERREPERLKIVAQQYEVENSPDGGTDANGGIADQHTFNQRRLLSNEANILALLQQKINGTASTTTPYSDIIARNVVNPPPVLPNALSAADAAVPVVPLPTYSDLPPLETVSKTQNLPPSVSTGTRPVTPSASRYTECVLNPANARVTVQRRGIVNLGNSCYMNSVLQLLNATPLGQYFLTDEYIADLVTTEGKLTRLINSFSFVIRELNRTDCNFAVSASPFKSALGDYYEGFQNLHQQDANEFLRVLLDGIHGALNVSEKNKIAFPEIDNSKGTDDELARRYWAQYYQRNSSVIVQKCAFQERSMIVCPSCNHQSRSFNAALSIEVPVPTNSSRVSLDDCLAAYCREEVLDNSSLYLCPNCRQKVNAKKQLLFYSTPPLLFITLKRFRTFGDFSTASKVNADVFFNKVLNIAPYMCSTFSKTTYRLVGIVNHQGNMHGGHYTADAIGADGVWCNFSDERVTKSEPANNELAYILCYVR